MDQVAFVQEIERQTDATLIHPDMWANRE